MGQTLEAQSCEALGHWPAINVSEARKLTLIIAGRIASLLRILSAYAAYYNQTRTHLALQKDAPWRVHTNVCIAMPVFGRAGSGFIFSCN